MAYTQWIDALKLWTQESLDEQLKLNQQILQGIDQINERSSDLFSRIPKGKSRPQILVRWQERYGYQLTITGTLATSTITFSGYIGGAAISAGALRNHVQLGTVLERQSDGVQMRVTAEPTYSSLTADVEAHGNTGSLSDDSSAVTYDIIGISTTDYNETHEPQALDTSWRKCGTQIFEQCFEYPHTWSNVDLVKESGIRDKVADQVKQIMLNLRHLIARSAIRVFPVYSSGYKYGDEVANPCMTGLTAWPAICNGELAKTNTYVNMSGAQITTDALDNLIYYNDVDEQADYSKGNWWIACDKVTRRYISTFDEQIRQTDRKDKTAGYYITEYISREGERFPLLTDRYMKAGTCMLINLDNCSWGFVKDDEPWTKDLATQSRTSKKLITCQPYGVAVRLPRQIAMLYGMPTSFA